MPVRLRGLSAASPPTAGAINCYAHRPLRGHLNKSGNFVHCATRTALTGYEQNFAFVQCALGVAPAVPPGFGRARGGFVARGRLSSVCPVSCGSHLSSVRPVAPSVVPLGGGGAAFGSGAFARLVWWSPPALRGSGRVRCSLVRLRGLCRVRGAVGRCGRPLRLRGLWLRAPAPPLGRGACWRSGGAVPRPSGGVSCALRCGRPLRSGGLCRARRAASLWSPPPPRRCAPPRPPPLRSHPAKAAIKGATLRLRCPGGAGWRQLGVAAAPAVLAALRLA